MATPTSGARRPTYGRPRRGERGARCTVAAWAVATVRDAAITQHRLGLHGATGPLPALVVVTGRQPNVVPLKVCARGATAGLQAGNAVGMWGRVRFEQVGEDKAALFGEVSSLETQLAQAHADREEARVWANTYREMLVKVA